MSDLKELISSMLNRNTNDSLNRDQAKASLIESASFGTENPIDAHKTPEIGRHLEVQSWLPMASQVYNISPNIKDYVVVPVIIMPSDLPNRNSVSFPHETLIGFNPIQGRLNYKTWSGKPCYAEHNHFKMEEAKGIVFDTYMSKLNHAKGNLFKVTALCGFDRTKDYALAQEILTGRRKSYSMGAFVSQYECSICGETSKRGKLNTECGHVIRGKPKFYETKYGYLPSYLLARIGIEGFEVSSVTVPAWSSAVNSNIMDLAKV